MNDVIDALADLHFCDEVEVQYVLQHLAADQGAGPSFLCELPDGVQWLKGWVRGLKAIGELPTIWTELAGVKSQAIHERPVFCVREVLPVLQQPLVPRAHQLKDDLATIEHMVAQLASGTAPVPVVVLAACALGLYIVDGNKTAVAHYEHAQRLALPDWRLPVYLPLEPPDGSGGAVH